MPTILIPYCDRVGTTTSSPSRKSVDGRFPAKDLAKAVDRAAKDKISTEQKCSRELKGRVSVLGLFFASIRNIWNRIFSSSKKDIENRKKAEWLKALVEYKNNNKTFDELYNSWEKINDFSFNEINRGNFPIEFIKDVRQNIPYSIAREHLNKNKISNYYFYEIIYTPEYMCRAETPIDEFKKWVQDHHLEYLENLPKMKLGKKKDPSVLTKICNGLLSCLPTIKRKEKE